MGTINRGVVWIDGQFLNASDLNGEFNIIHDEFNGNIDNANIKTAAAIAGTKIATDFGQQPVTLQELAADPANLTNKGHIYTKDVSGGTELFFEDAAGNVIQITSGGALISSSVIMPGYIYGCVLAPNGAAPTSKVDIGVGALEVEESGGTGPVIIEVTSTLVIDMGTTGTNGLDTGSPGINHYHAYVIYDPSGPTIASLASLSATSPTLPSGYTKFRRVGSFYNTASGSANIRAFKQIGKGPDRAYQFDNVNVAASVTAGAWTSLGLSTVVPATADFVFGIMGRTDAGSGSPAFFIGPAANEIFDAGISATPFTTIEGFSSCDGFGSPIKTAQTIYYYATSVTTQQIDISGYKESI